MTVYVQKFFKSPTDILDYVWDWSSWLPVGDSISTATFTAATGLTKEVSPAASHTGTTATVWLGGGTAADEYEVTCEILTAGGRDSTWATTVVIEDPLVCASAPRIVNVPQNAS